MAKEIVNKIIRAPGFLNEPIEYNKSFSRGVRVSFGRLSMLFISGTASINEEGKTCYPGNFAAQAKRTFENLTALLNSEGAKWQNVVQTRCYLRHMRDYDEFNLIRNRFYQKEGVRYFPASVCIEAKLCRPELLVEIEAMAVLKGGRNAISRKVRAGLRGSSNSLRKRQNI